MADKDGACYLYEQYGSKPQNNGTTANTMMTTTTAGTLLKKIEPPSSLKTSGAACGKGQLDGGRLEDGANGGGGGGGRRRCCSCLSPKAASFWVALLTNLGICTLLLAYTLFGSFIFLAIEGGAAATQMHHQQQQQHQRTLASTTNQRQPVVLKPALRLDNMSLSTASMQDTNAARQRTVESIWDITVSLNILYRENWTRLAALEIARFQDQLIERITSEMTAQLESGSSSGSSSGSAPQTGAVMVLHHGPHGSEYDWTFARAFLYSLTVLTTIGHGNIAPRTTLGRIATMAYALLGIPLTLIYLSSTGGVLAKVARGVFSRALCCCLCSNCGYCCYDEKRMADKERRMKKKREQEELRAQHMAMQEPYYVRSGSLHNNLHSPDKQIVPSDADSLSVSESRASGLHGLSILAPILLCFSIMVIYIVLGALALYHLEQWPLVDGIYFCFMSLSTIGFGDLVPGLRHESTTTTWFCSAYIMSGMALTAMCFNVLHEELAHRVQKVVEVKAHHRLSGGGGVGGVEDPSDYLGS